MFPEPSGGKSYALNSILKVPKSNSKALGSELPRRESRSEINFYRNSIEILLKYPLWEKASVSLLMLKLGKGSHTYHNNHNIGKLISLRDSRLGNSRPRSLELDLGTLKIEFRACGLPPEGSGKNILDLRSHFGSSHFGSSHFGSSLVECICRIACGIVDGILFRVGIA